MEGNLLSNTAECEVRKQGQNKSVSRYHWNYRVGGRRKLINLESKYKSFYNSIILRKEKKNQYLSNIKEVYKEMLRNWFKYFKIIYMNYLIKLKLRLFHVSN